jgi:hypothetical protein
MTSNGFHPGYSGSELAFLIINATATTLDNPVGFVDITSISSCTALWDKSFNPLGLCISGIDEKTESRRVIGHR